MGVKYRKASELTRGASWRKFTENVAGKNDAIKPELRKFRQLVPELIGADVDSTTLDDAAADAFAACIPASGFSNDGEIFSPLSKTGAMDAAQHIRERFGSRVSPQTTKEIVQLAGAICGMLPKGMRIPTDLMTHKSSSENSNQVGADSAPAQKTFGEGVAFHFESDGAIRKQFQQTKRIQRKQPLLAHAPTTHDSKVNNTETASTPMATSTTLTASSAAEPAASEVVDNMWLRRLCERNCDTVGDAPAAEVMCMAVYDLLASGSSDEVCG